MTIRCFVFRPGRGHPEVYTFASLPRIGEGINLPDHHQTFFVQSVDHMARERTDKDRPTVQMHLKSLPSYRNHLPEDFPRRQSLPVRWRR
jgi:hypothetical protein